MPTSYTIASKVSTIRTTNASDSNGTKTQIVLDSISIRFLNFDHPNYSHSVLSSYCYSMNSSTGKQISSDELILLVAAHLFITNVESTSDTSNKNSATIVIPQENDCYYQC